MKPPRSTYILVAAQIALAALNLQGATLYETEFEEFPTGADQWVGTNGWSGTSTGQGVHGIDQDLLPGLGKTAYLGFNQPDSTFVTVFRSLAYDPVTNGTPIIEFETLMGIEDSTNGFRDSFFFTFYNSGGDLLASLRFDNTDLDYGIWRLDGSNQTDTGVAFIRSELHILFASIDFSNNTWTADLDGIPLFTGAPFNATGAPLDLGFSAVEWQLTAPTTNGYGDNWILVADMAIRAFPAAGPLYSVGNLFLDSGGAPTLEWTGFDGFDDRVEYTDDLRLVRWNDDLPGSLFTNITVETSLSFTDFSATNTPLRSYRINRAPTP